MKINRLEIIDYTTDLEGGGGRAYVKWTEKNFKLDFDIQDNGKTLKIFLLEEVGGK